MCDKIVFCFHKFNVLFQFFSAQRFNLCWWKNYCFDLINHLMRNSIIHEFHTHRMFSRIQCFISVGLQNVEIQFHFFSWQSHFKSHAFNGKFLNQFCCSKHSAFIKIFFIFLFFYLFITRVEPQANTRYIHLGFSKTPFGCNKFPLVHV